MHPKADPNKKADLIMDRPFFWLFVPPSFFFIRKIFHARVCIPYHELNGIFQIGKSLL